MEYRRRRHYRPHLYIMRGLPGSGKTKLAREIMEKYGNSGEILSTDDFFMHDGVYKFKYRHLNTAHQWNRERAEIAMKNRVHPIIIDNTNMRLCEMKPYVEMGLDYRYYIIFKETKDTWECSIDELLLRTKGGIPKWVMERMLQNYQPARNIYDVLNDDTYYD
ncbi:hypothetical protein AGOR_G00027080 [Albula goreensis]|uniref:NEDD4-binding protein 2-like 1 n=1 Tax=Albula goreensis TaxID=1534307 RepID=A0A8T3E996_9TELE|nr:hypothetical protein AGOR_G00027080 [Albula goreensis]